MKESVLVTFFVMGLKDLHVSMKVSDLLTLVTRIRQIYFLLANFMEDLSRYSYI